MSERTEMEKGESPSGAPGGGAGDGGPERAAVTSAETGSSEGEATAGDNGGKKTRTRDEGAGIIGQVAEMHSAIQKMMQQEDAMPALLDRPDLKPRVVAFMMDFFGGVALVFVAMVVGSVVGDYLTLNLAVLAGAMVSAAYMLAKDGLHKSASPGKMAVGLRVVDQEGHFIGIQTSALRNLLPASPFIVLSIHCLSSIVLPSVAGYISFVLALGSGAGIVYETWSMLADRKKSRRFGDVRAGTEVVDADY